MVSGNKKHSSERKKYEPKAKSSFINKTNEAGNNISSVEPTSDVLHKNEEDEVNETGEQNTSVEEKPNVPPASNIVENDDYEEVDEVGEVEEANPSVEEIPNAYLISDTTEEELRELRPLLRRYSPFVL